MIHIVILNYYYEEGCDSEEALLARYFLLTEWAESLEAAGAKVTVFQRYRHDTVVERNGVTYLFVADRYPPKLRHWQLPLKMTKRIRQMCCEKLKERIPTVIHQNGLIFPLQTYFLRTMLPKDCAVAAQHHAERPWTGVKALLQQWGLKAVDGFLFATREQASDWMKNHIIRSQEDVYEVMEASSLFMYRDRENSRKITHMTGSPVILWTGNLNYNKDPLTILAGFERILPRVPQAHLYMAYRYTDLLPQVQDQLRQNPELAQAVTLLGKISHPEIEAYYNSADIFVQGSAKEGSGIALLDALACGVIPVVTDIPAFRTITGDGKIGVLWPHGHAEDFAAAMLQVLQHPLKKASKETCDFFEKTWCYPVISRKALSAYQTILRKFLATA